MKKEVESVLKTLSEADNESTAAPYWLILDPRKRMGCDVHMLASMITGPFFSRTDAEIYLSTRRYNYSKHAQVYCCSGCFSEKYVKLYKSITKDGKKNGNK